MYSFEIDCPNEGLGRVMQALKADGITTDSRNGPVIRFPKPVCLEYPNPRRRVLDHPVRDANHFFHLIETMWMFAGMDTVKELDLFNEQFKQYSDDGERFAAPYGYRWRHHFGFDQLVTAVEKLKANPEDRRVVIQIWDAKELEKKEGKDFACNQNIMLDTRPVGGGSGDKKIYALDMTVTNRSNDLIYGAMGSNLFHMSMLHEYLAMHSGLALGTYYQISKNMHLYLNNPTSKRCWENMNYFDAAHPSSTSDVSLSEKRLTLHLEPIRDFVQTHRVPSMNFNEIHRIEGNEDHTREYLGQVVKPLVEAYKIYKLKKQTGLDSAIEARVDLALEFVDQCQSDPLRQACVGWLNDKQTKAREKKTR